MEFVEKTGNSTKKLENLKGIYWSSATKYRHLIILKICARKQI